MEREREGGDERIERKREEEEWRKEDRRKRGRTDIQCSWSGGGRGGMVGLGCMSLRRGMVSGPGMPGRV